MTRDDVFDALVQRVIEVYGDDQTEAAKRARFMVNSWTWVHDNSVDDRGHITVYDWLDSRVAWLLDYDEALRFGVPPQTEDAWRRALQPNYAVQF
jgi:hypothetical protein